MKAHAVEFTVEELSTLQIALVIATQQFLVGLQTSGLPVNKNDTDRYNRMAAMQQKVCDIFAEAIAKD